MIKYVGRKKELELLDEKYNSNQFEFGYLYGQRRIGKTTLIEMFKRNKKSLVFFATDSDNSDIRRSFTKILNKYTNSKIGNYDDWYSFFEEIDHYFEDEKGLVVIDEYPNIVLTRDGKRKKTDFASALQRAIDTLFKHRKFTLILTGSNVSFMKEEITNSRAPLYERNTFSLLLKKFDWDEAVEALSDIKDDNEKAKIISLVNTFPYYISLIDQKKSFMENLDNLFYKQTAVFTDDPSKLITTDIATGGLYASILANISKGNNTLAILCELLNCDSSKMSKYINELMSNDVIRKRHNFNSYRNIKYEICDPMLAFYYRFIRESGELIKTGYGSLIKKEQFNEIDDFIHRGFENICITYLEFLNKQGELNTLYTEFNHCQIDNTQLSRSIELDVVSNKNNYLLVGECKFSNNKRTIKDYYDLKEDLSLEIFKTFTKQEIYLFASNGFDDKVRKVMDESLHLVDLKTMFNTKKYM